MISNIWKIHWSDKYDDQREIMNEIEWERVTETAKKWFEYDVDDISNT